MKIIVLDRVNFNVEVLNVNKELIKNKRSVNEFLTSHGYSLADISWMAASVDHIPLCFHEYSTDPEKRETYTMRASMLKNFSVYDSVKQIQYREQSELADALRRYGNKVNDGYEWYFADNFPIVAAYGGDDPCDVVVRAVKMDKYGFVNIIGEDKNCQEYELNLKAEDFFAGQLDYITSAIRE